MFGREPLKPSTYYWEFLKRFGKECYRSWRVEFYIALAVNLINYFLTMKDKGAWEATVKFLEANLILYAVFVTYHFIRTPYLMHHEHGHPENGGMERVAEKFGAFGCVLVAGIIAALTYGVFKISFYQSPIIVTIIQTPSLPNITIAYAPPSTPTPGDVRLKRPQKTPVSQVPEQTVGAQPLTQPPITQQPAPVPVAQFDRLVAKNKNLTVGDRNRLGDALYDYAQFLDQGRTLGYKMNTELGRLGQDRQSGSLATNVGDHVKTLKDMDAPFWAYYHGLQAMQDKWKYYQDESDYILGDNPYNLGPGALINTEEGLTGFLQSWAKIENRNQPDVLNLVAMQQSDFQTLLTGFFHWAQGCDVRLSQIKQTIQ